MRELVSLGWLPVDTILGREVARATDAALAPLAAEARRLRRVTVWGILVLFGAALWLILGSGMTGGWELAGFVGVGAASVAMLVAFQKRKMWDGDARWLRLYGRQIPQIDLPEAAGQLLAELRSGRRHARHRRGQSDPFVDLPTPLFRGPFGPLILSSDAHVQGLALWDWYGGDRLSVEIEATPMQDDAPADLPHAATPFKPAPIAGEGLLATKRRAEEKPSRFNRLLFLSEAELDAVLRRTYPEAFEVDPDRKVPHRSKLIVRTLQLARTRLAGRHYATVAQLRDEVVRQLRKEGIEHHGLSESADKVSISWMEHALSHRSYPAIEREIEAATPPS